MTGDAILAIEGRARPLSPEASLALYRGAQEALTNVARDAPGANTRVLLRYTGDRATLSIEDRDGEPTQPDVVLMDLRMPRMEGAQATREIRAALPETQVLVLTTYADDESLFPALRAGARGYLTKDASAEEIEQAIRALVAGHTHLDRAVQQRLVAAVLESSPPAAAHTPPGQDDLTPRETEVLRLIADGLSNTEIASRLVVSRATVKTHVNRIFSKTGARDRAQAVRYAYERGLV
jgi:DNA-binding NarL/FixJ family response regulator